MAKPQLRRATEEMITPDKHLEKSAVIEIKKQDKPAVTKSAKNVATEKVTEKVDKRHSNKGRPTFEQFGLKKRESKLSVYVLDSTKEELINLAVYKGKKSVNELVNDMLVKEIAKMKKDKKNQG